MTERQRRWIAYWGAWGLLGLYMTSMDMVMYPKESALRYLLPLNLCQNLAVGLAGLGVLALARRWPLEHLSKGSWPRWLLHFLATVAIAFVAVTVMWIISIQFVEPAIRAKLLAEWPRAYRRFLTMYFHVNLLLMWAVLGAFHGLRIFDQFRKRELEAAQLESRLSQAQNQALRMQLQPHFLFNTLNSISALIHSDPEAADRMLARLADLLRMTLEAGQNPEIPLRQEMAFIDAYLSIEGIRFQDRLRIEKEVEPQCQEAQVPVFLLQPLVENAIKHGVGDLARASTILIRARRDTEWLVLDVVDDGRGLEGHAKGIGTQNTSSRLQLMFPDRHAFTLKKGQGRGTHAQVRIPWSTGGAAP